ncbi:hypothetical protein NDU88_005294 [Pleurodeles waltl]|uniref:Uncharacterized protein n=1 Tax=Pleurodeles waltl TaxID=8319 RepID=A0AAV7SLD3_PLEWA|nr:hypothetical protein NDU88_005294 [Pleurodeles waltl]
MSVSDLRLCRTATCKVSTGSGSYGSPRSEGYLKDYGPAGRAHSKSGHLAAQQATPPRCDTSLMGVFVYCGMHEL